jgi:hypothetical protein
MLIPQDWIIFFYGVLLETSKQKRKEAKKQLCVFVPLRELIFRELHKKDYPML